jgi:hypothetical protein
MFMVANAFVSAGCFSQWLLWECLERGIPLITGPRFPDENLSPRGFSGKQGALFSCSLGFVFLLQKKKFNHGGYEGRIGFVIFLPWCALRPRGFFYFVAAPAGLGR